jgi:carotenoid 1,2-hydratase
MTERGARHVVPAGPSLAIGPSSLVWHDDTLTVTIDELTAPWPSRIRGTVRLQAPARPDRVVALDADGRHRWRPLAPCARVEVDLRHPGLAWSGPGYLDANDGDAPLDEAFARWHWSRAVVHDGTAILYDVERRGGARLAFGLHCAPSGLLRDIPLPPEFALPRSAWRVPRVTRADPGDTPRIVRTLEDAPFYARSLVASAVLGERVVAVHESLSLDRFRARWVQLLLPFRMPRRR